MSYLSRSSRGLLWGGRGDAGRPMETASVRAEPTPAGELSDGGLVTAALMAVEVVAVELVAVGMGRSGKGTGQEIRNEELKRPNGPWR